MTPDMGTIMGIKAAAMGADMLMATTGMDIAKVIVIKTVVRLRLVSRDFLIRLSPAARGLVAVVVSRYP
ncbi:MAG: hypothetical protein ACRDBM_16270 [Sporomusa sp.]